MTASAGKARDLHTGIALVLAVLVGDAAAAPVPRFERDILPILQRRCTSCHNEDMREGQLGLHDRSSIERGGESGQKIINVPLEHNELWRRVAGDDPELRMPPEGPPLDGADLALIERWARAGAPWPDAEARLAASAADESPWFLWLGAFVPAQLDPFLARVDRWRAGYGSVFYLVMALFTGSVLGEALKRRYAKSPLGDLLRRCATRTVYGWLAVAIAAWGAWLHVAALQAREQELAARVAELEGEARQRTTQSANITEALAGARPKHPLRLGGTYYRGNDERSRALFNGGFYRTATMHLALCDGNDRRLAWGDSIASGDVFIRLEIERAPNATPTLYKPAIMAKAFLSPCQPSTTTAGLASLVYRLETLEEGERWVGRVPIAGASEQASGDMLLEGDLYLYNCVPKEDHIPERPHFGIRYHIVVKGGVIQSGSDLWMGSLYRLSKIFYPPPDRILPTEWFDFREIPVIEGDNSNDPALLGVEEHRGKFDDP